MKSLFPLYRSVGGLLRAASLAMVLICLLVPSELDAQEIRGLWVDTFHPAMRTSNEVAQLVATARAGHFNSLFVEVRRRCDAYYNSFYEPKASDVSPQAYDPLEDLIQQAHAVEPRIEIHAWMTTYLAWNNRTAPPPQPDHPYRLHPDWLSKNAAGISWDGQNFTFDPGHPEVQRHVFNVAMDLVSRYAIDGLQFDYVRYSGKEWGYNQESIARFHASGGKPGFPSPTDPAWLQFRRDQVTALVRKVYLSAMSIKPGVKISAATICWAPGLENQKDWFARSAAWNNVLQDWRGWMEEGILDLNVPMAYFRERSNAMDWTRWNRFIKNNRYGRQAAMGVGAYLNSVQDVLDQIRSTRDPTPEGSRADGAVLYTLSQLATNLPALKFIATLVETNLDDPSLLPLFRIPLEVPAMEWKENPQAGHLKGTVMNSESEERIEGVLIKVDSEPERVTLSDATGFYGFANLAPGNYKVSTAVTNEESAAIEVLVNPGLVTTLDLKVSLKKSLPSKKSPAPKKAKPKRGA